jgi:DNA-binding MarR family transcriptional regulator
MSREALIFAIIDRIRANQVLTDMLDEAAADYLGINRTDARALDVIDQHRQITAGELARELRMSTGAVTTVVDRLEHAGLARRIPDADDRRRVLIETTPVVTETAKRIYGDYDDVLGLYDDYSDEDLELILRFQEFGRAWLEDRLARAADLARDPKPEARGATERRGRR